MEGGVVEPHEEVLPEVGVALHVVAEEVGYLSKLCNVINILVM